ncbi:MAG: tRNA (adenosine(37)-N6)-threonylcarbamoyltransferase complex dimerization subunit type 1 TsaB, partial [Acidobacteriaceae bacterium]|nr:tRNA (adenosine(37)-N6)-threonylcarbamoyltransferase complex dimerization subunit type 1 TsaB [Acidobacteriaceae bacterium]
GQVAAARTVHAPEGFAHVVFPVIEQVLEEAGVALRDIDCFAAASGPGSFTGVRVGLSAVKGLAAALGKPAVGVSNLKALASLGTRPLRIASIDARRSQHYVAVYDADLQVVVPEAVVNLADWQKTLPTEDYELITLAGDLSAAVAAVAEKETWGDPALLDANYVRQSDAELFWRDGV